MRKSFAFFVLAWLLSASAAARAEPASSPQLSACLDKSEGVTSEMLECTFAETERQDQRLNTAYKKLLTILSPGQQERLRKAQRAWIEFRDANSLYQYDPDGGSIAHVLSASAYLDMTAARADELEQFLAIETP